MSAPVQELPVDFNAAIYHLSQVCALCTDTVFPKLDPEELDPSRLSNGSRCSEKKQVCPTTPHFTLSDWPTDLRVSQQQY